MWWKLYFALTLCEVGLVALSLFSMQGIHIATQIVMAILFLIAVVGVYSYVFRKKILNQLFWQYFLGIYILIDLVYLAYVAAPHAPLLSSLSFLAVYSNPSLADTLIDIAVDIPLLYAIYRLTKEDPYAEKEKKVMAKNVPYQWGMIQTALWGYSTVLIFFLLIVALIPSANQTAGKPEAADPYYFTSLFAPLLLFWLWIVAHYKRYKWNWWRTTLAANGLLYSGMIFWQVIFPQKVQDIPTGFDIVSILQLLILLLGLWVFGKTQFQKEEKEK
ncbi:MAG: hypothetical protein ACREHC_03780 [Candidatus Levyibacteriota bacterium]